jgi:superfamily I DNA/RNA helicase
MYVFIHNFFREPFQAEHFFSQGTSVTELITLVTESIGYEQHLRHAYGPDADARLENIKELK